MADARKHREAVLDGAIRTARGVAHLEGENARAWEEIARLRALLESKGFCADCGFRLNEAHCAPTNWDSEEDPEYGNPEGGHQWPEDATYYHGGSPI